MGKNFDQIVEELRKRADGTRVQITLVTNQDDQIVSYATGELVYQRRKPVEAGKGEQVKKLEGTFDGTLVPVEHMHPSISDYIFDGQWEKLESTRDEPLQHLFSDEFFSTASGSTGNSFGTVGRLQPFSVYAAGKLGMSFRSQFDGWLRTDPVTVHFTLLGKEKVQFNVELTPLGNLLYGVGQSVRGLSNSAVYVISFSEPYWPWIPK